MEEPLSGGLPARGRRGVGAPQDSAWAGAGSIPRPDRSVLFPVLVAAAALNGLSTRIIGSIGHHGLIDALLSTFDVSAVIWMAIGIALFLLRQARGPATDLDLTVAAFVLLAVLLPVAPLAFMGLALLSVHICRSSPRNSPAWRGGWIALGVTVPTFWSPNIFKMLSDPILNADAAMVGWLADLPRNGNAVGLADGSGSLWIAPQCSSLANVSLAILCWMTFMRAEGLPITRRSLSWCLLGCALVVFVNVGRISLIALRPDWYETIHGPEGAIAANWIISALIVAVGLGSVRSGHAHGA